MSAAPDPFEIIGALADEARLRVLAALVLGARTTDDVAARAGLAKRETLRALSRLAALGLVEPAGSAWDVRADRLRAAAAAAREKPARLDYLEATSEEAGVLRNFLPYGRLLAIPAHRGKRGIVLDHVVRVFEPGRRYSEREVNTLLRAFYDDYVTLRRHLVDEGLLSRASGEYWRTGGTVVI